MAIHPLLKKCKLCNNEFLSNISFCSHLYYKHKLTLNQYILDNIEIPICKYCNINHVELYKSVLNGNKKTFWKKHCNNKECISKYLKEIQLNYWNNNNIAKEKARKRRIEYLKKKTGKSAWQRRQNGQMSYLQQWFYDNCILKYNLYNKYDIINEYCEYPYFIDFAFINIKVAVQLDGKCHFINGQSRIKHDEIKDEYLKEKGWKIFRIKYNENNQKTIEQFFNYINNIINNKKQLSNKIYKYSEIKIIKNNKKKLNKIKLQYIEFNKSLIELVKNSNIDFSKFGWVNKVAILINKKPQKVRAWMKKYMNEFLIQNNVFTRKINGRPTSCRTKTF